MLAYEARKKLEFIRDVNDRKLAAERLQDIINLMNEMYENTVTIENILRDQQRSKAEEVHVLMINVQNGLVKIESAISNFIGYARKE
jgi:hypothetical protein